MSAPLLLAGLADRHACRGCGRVECVLSARSECERLLRASESWWRLSPSEQRACLRCGRDVFSAPECTPARVAVAA